MRSAPSIAFDVRPSRLLAASVVVVALLAVIAIVLCGLPLQLRMLLAAAVVVLTLPTLGRLRNPPLASVAWHDTDTWALRLASGIEIEGRLQSGRVLGPLIVLRLAWAPRGRAALALLPDNLDADTRRRLRMRLSALPDNG